MEVDFFTLFSTFAANVIVMLDEEFKYYLSHQDDLVKKYNGRYIVIKEQTVIGDYSSFDEAIKNTLSQGHELGSFLIQECSEGEDAYTQTFHSRVIFA